MAQQRLKVGFTYDATEDYALEPGDLPDKYAEFDAESTLSEIANALATGGHEIVRIGHVKNLLARIAKGERWDIVFNIAEGVKGRNREAQVPAVLEIYDIPYVGSDALSMGITLDKAVAKAVVSHHGLATPRFIEATTPEEATGGDLRFPMIVKPSEEGTSKGLLPESIVWDNKHLHNQTRWVIDTYRQPALVEEFIVGQEFTVAVIGNKDPEVLPPVQISLKGDVNLGKEIYTHERVTTDEIQYLCPAPAPKELIRAMEVLSAGAYSALGCRDFGRIDIRVDESGKPYFLECNTLPNLGIVDVFPLVAKASGTTYEKILCRILEYGCTRYGLL